jgi:hypothetical protein
MLRRIREELEDRVTKYLKQRQLYEVVVDDCRNEVQVWSIKEPPIGLLRRYNSPFLEVPWVYYGIGRKEDIDTFERMVETGSR